jgi:hypothetical protein
MASVFRRSLGVEAARAQRSHELGNAGGGWLRVQRVGQWGQLGPEISTKVLQKLWLRVSCHTISHLLPRHRDPTYHYSVIPREKSQFNQSSYKIVPCSDVAGYEDEDGHS